MWYPLPAFQKADPAFATSARELFESTARSLILTTIGMAVGLLLVVYLSPPAVNDIQTMPILYAVILTCCLSLYFLPRHFVAAVAAWQVTLGALVLLAVYRFQQPIFGFFLALFPLLTVVTLGWPAALVCEGIVAGLAWWLSHSALWPPLPVTFGLGIAVGGVVSGLLGWATTRTLYTVASWSIFSFHQAQQRLDEAYTQRVEFAEVKEDLLQANMQLARLSDRLKAMYQVAEEARHAKEEFVANVSHELRTPLNMIIGFSDIITHSPEVYGRELPPALLADITAIQRNSQHLSRLVDDVLDLSQAEAGKAVLTKEWVSLRDIVEAASLAVGALYKSKGLYLRTIVPADLPDVFCDATRIRQVVLNLLSNAGRFTQLGGVVLSAWLEGEHITVSVSDTGPGVAAEDQIKLFQPFQQLDASLNRAHGGTGLGLTISKRFVEMHDGKMWMESPARLEDKEAQALGDGATPWAGVGEAKPDLGGPGASFYFTLPIQTPEPAMMAQGAPALRWFNRYQPYEERTRGSRAPLPVPSRASYSLSWDKRWHAAFRSI